MTAALAAVACVPFPASAEQPFYKSGALTIAAFGEAGVYAGSVSHANFGRGVVDRRSNRMGTPSPDLFEGYLEPGLRVSAVTPQTGIFYGQASAVAALSEGQGDAGGFTRGNERALDPETFHVGWRSGGLFPELGTDAVDFSVGAQEFTVGDQFLFGDGNGDAFGDGTYILGPRNAFRNSAVLRFNTAPLRGDLFYLRADKEQDSAEQFGANLEYAFEGGRVGGAVMRIPDARSVYTAREGMNVWDARFAFDTVPGVPDLVVSGEAVRQSGSTAGTGIDALGWHATGRYTLNGVPWSPYVRYRHSRFSGDDPDTAAREGYDALYYGWTQYGDWYQGNIVGNYFLFNSNQRSHMVQIGASPAPWLQLDLLFFRFDLDQAFYNDTRTSDRHFADEIDFVIQVYPKENLWLGFSYGYATPGRAAMEAVGDDKPMHAIEVFLVATF